MRGMSVFRYGNTGVTCWLGHDLRGQRLGALVSFVVPGSILEALVQ